MPIVCAKDVSVHWANRRRCPDLVRIGVTRVHNFRAAPFCVIAFTDFFLQERGH